MRMRIRGRFPMDRLKEMLRESKVRGGGQIRYGEVAFSIVFLFLEIMEAYWVFDLLG